MRCAGAGALGLVLTAVLPNILEDALAVALAAAVGYLALLNLPLRRAEAKGKAERVAANFAKVGLNPNPQPYTWAAQPAAAPRVGQGQGGSAWPPTSPRWSRTLTLESTYRLLNSPYKQGGACDRHFRQG